MNAVAQQTSGDKTAIRPFQVNVSEAKIAKLRSRIDATEWPDRETVADESQGVPLATMQELARYWATDLLVNEHRSFCGSLLLGKSHQPLQRRRRLHPGCGKRLSW
jgi:hypothetical protein